MSVLPPYVSRELVAERLPEIFPEGINNRNYLTREMAASTVFTMLYIGAVEGSGIYLGPVHVYRMTNEQSLLSDNDSRTAYALAALKKNFSVHGKRWYADNTREPLRDETLREGLVQVGVVISLDVPTTSSKPRYALKNEFADLFNPDLNSEELDRAILEWQNQHLSASALARLKLLKHSSKASENKVKVTFPSGEVRLLSPGPSSIISKDVIEVFASLFLKVPTVLWLSTSDNKIVQKDDDLAKEIGINIAIDKNLPDIILADLGPKDPLIVFVEVVATDGPISDRRKEALLQLTDAGNFRREQVAFLTAYLHRDSAPFKKTIPSLAWNSFAWFAGEPDKLLFLKDGAVYISNFLNPGE